MWHAQPHTRIHSYTHTHIVCHRSLWPCQKSFHTNNNKQRASHTLTERGEGRRERRSAWVQSVCLTGWACLFNQQTGSLIRVEQEREREREQEREQEEAHRLDRNVTMERQMTDARWQLPCWKMSQLQLNLCLVYVCVCVCVSLFCSCVRCLVRELRKFFCYLNHVSLSKQHLPIQARQQLPHLLPRLLQRPEAVATVSLPSFFLLLLVLLCALWPQTSRRSLFLASCQVAISSRKNICAPFASLLLLLLLLSFLLLLSLCNFRCVLREHKTFHRSIRNCWTLFDYAVLCCCCSWSFWVLLLNIVRSLPG